MTGLPAELHERREVIDRALHDWLARVTRHAPSALTEAMSYSLLANGKRLRPLLTVLTCAAAGGASAAALPAACAVEMVHTYSLIHDDLPAMDDDDLRRGLPTSHKKFGEATAILAGDALLTGAFQVLSEGCPERTAAVSIAELSRGAGAAGMVAGQVLDLAAEGQQLASASASIEELQRIHRCKTGALMLSAVRLGLFAAQAESGIDELLQNSLDRFGRSFGLAFQIADDLLDVQATAEQVGKRVGKDAVRGKLTFPGLVGVEESRRLARSQLSEANAALSEIGPVAAQLAALTARALQFEQ